MENIPLIKSLPEELKKITEAKNCWSCDSPCHEEEEGKEEEEDGEEGEEERVNDNVRDTCQLTEKKRGTAHTHCN